MKQTLEWFERHQVTPETTVWIEAQETMPTGYIVKGDAVCVDRTKTTPAEGKYYLTAGGSIITAATAIKTDAVLAGECFYREGDGKDCLAA